MELSACFHACVCVTDSVLHVCAQQISFACIMQDPSAVEPYIYRQGLGEARYDAPAGLDVCGDWLHFLICVEDVRTASLNDHFGL